MNVRIISGDITQTSADAMITAINSGRMWFGGIDDAIKRVAGNYFHAQAAHAELMDGHAIVVKGQRDAQRKFDHVVFVVDDLERPLRHIIEAGLIAAHNEGFTSVSLPTIRMGLMLGVIEKTTEEAVNEMTAGVRSFVEKTKNPSIQDLTFVVYNDPKTDSLLRTNFAHPL